MLHGQKDLIKTSLLHEIIKEISSSNGQSHATKKNNACNVKRQRKNVQTISNRSDANRIRFGWKRAKRMTIRSDGEKPIGWG